MDGPAIWCIVGTFVRPSVVTFVGPAVGSTVETALGTADGSTIATALGTAFVTYFVYTSPVGSIELVVSWLEMNLYKIMKFTCVRV